MIELIGEIVEMTLSGMESTSLSNIRNISSFWSK